MSSCVWPTGNRVSTTRLHSRRCTNNSATARYVALAFSPPPSNWWYTVSGSGERPLFCRLSIKRSSAVNQAYTDTFSLPAILPKVRIKWVPLPWVIMHCQRGER